MNELPTPLDVLRATQRVAPSIPFRVKFETLTGLVYEKIENDGFFGKDGQPHPLLGELVSLMRTGAELRRVSMDRRLALANGQFSENTSFGGTPQ